MQIGSPTWARTRDLRINSPSLYQLSYRGNDADEALNYSFPAQIGSTKPADRYAPNAPMHQDRRAVMDFAAVVPGREEPFRQDAVRRDADSETSTIA